MKTEFHNNRIVNGLLKADIGLQSPEEVRARLSRDILIRVNSKRSGYEDLWPCVWFLASILERQFFGNIYINSGLTTALRSPVPLGPRCVFVGHDFVHGGLELGVGMPTENADLIWGDVKGTKIAYQDFAGSSDHASPVSCCILAGYLGFAALASSAGIPLFHHAWTQKFLTLPLPIRR